MAEDHASSLSARSVMDFFRRGKQKQHDRVEPETQPNDFLSEFGSPHSSGRRPAVANHHPISKYDEDEYAAAELTHETARLRRLAALEVIPKQPTSLRPNPGSPGNVPVSRSELNEVGRRASEQSSEYPRGQRQPPPAAQHRLAYFTDFTRLTSPAADYETAIFQLQEAEITVLVGDYTSAEERLLLAHPFLKTHHQAYTVPYLRCVRLLGRVYSESQPKKALDFFTHAMDVCERMGVPDRSMWSWDDVLLIARTYTELAMYETAVQMFQCLLEKSIGDDSGDSCLGVMVYLAVVKQKLGAVAEVEKICQIVMSTLAAGISQGRRTVRQTTGILLRISNEALCPDVADLTTLFLLLEVATSAIDGQRGDICSLIFRFAFRMILKGSKSDAERMCQSLLPKYQNASVLRSETWLIDQVEEHCPGLVTEWKRGIEFFDLGVWFHLDTSRSNAIHLAIQSGDMEEAVRQSAGLDPGLYGHSSFKIEYSELQDIHTRLAHKRWAPSGQELEMSFKYSNALAELKKRGILGQNSLNGTDADEHAYAEVEARIKKLKKMLGVHDLTRSRSPSMGSLDSFKPSTRGCDTSISLVDGLAASETPQQSSGASTASAHASARASKDGSRAVQSFTTQTQLSQDTRNSGSPTQGSITDPESVKGLEAFFTNRQDQAYTDVEIHQVSGLTKRYNQRWSRVPRLYILLRSIECLNLLDGLLDVGFSDYWFPLSERSLPDHLTPATRVKLVAAQKLVLTKSIDLEKGDKGVHHYFRGEEPLPFESQGVLGAGGFGQVDRVLSQISFRTYARKRVTRKTVLGSRGIEAMKGIVAEIEILKKVRHQHIVEFVGSYTDRKYIGLIMSPVAEMDFAAYLHQAREPQFTEVRTFFGCLVTSVGYLHSNHIRHKDIKPQNILVNQGNILLTDFGLSLDFTDASGSTTVGMVNGMTARYCAPEVALREERNTSADIWSLAIVFLEMIILLKGVSRDAMDDYMESHGSRQLYVRSNPEAFEGFVAGLRDKGEASDNVTLDWTVDMLQRDRNARPSATSLLQSITAQREGKNRVFCGICCRWREGEDSDSSEEGEYEI